MKKKRVLVGWVLAGAASVFAMGSPSSAAWTAAAKPGAEFTTFMTDTGWCWYQDPRVIINNGKLVLGGISGQSGDVRVGIYDLESEQVNGATVLHSAFQRDDHNAPAFYVQPDGCLLAVYAQHGKEKIHHYRISEPNDYLKWGPHQEYHHTYEDKRGSTYMNLYTMKDEGLLYCFFRDGQHFNPAFITSADEGATWGNYQHFITHDIGGRQRPYARYLQRDENTVGISFTDGHPRQYGNSLYYADFHDGAFYRVDGTKIKDLAAGPLRTGEAEKIYTGSEVSEWKGQTHSVSNSAWTAAIAQDKKNRPHIGYTVYHTHDNHHYRVASWTGKKWNDRQIAFGGKCLYEIESSYTGLLTFDPDNPERVYISTDVNPSTGEFTGGVHEIYTAQVGPNDDVTTIKWQAITAGSKYKNIRPIVVAGSGYKVLTWLGNGPWEHFCKYQTDAIGVILERP